MSRTNLYGAKDVRATEVLLYSLLLTRRSGDSLVDNTLELNPGNAISIPSVSGLSSETL